MRGGGGVKKYLFFFPRSGYKAVHAVGGAVKKWQYPVHVVVNYPQVASSWHNTIYVGYI